MQIRAKASGGIYEWLDDRKNRRVIPHRLEACGYVAVRNPDAVDGYWQPKGERLMPYAKKTLSRRDQLKAVSKLLAELFVSRKT